MEPVISIQELARNCVAGASQRRKPVSGAIRQALTPMPVRMRAISKSLNFVATANARLPITAKVRKQATTFFGPCRSSQWPSGNCVAANPRK